MYSLLSLDRNTSKLEQIKKAKSTGSSENNKNKSSRSKCSKSASSFLATTLKKDVSLHSEILYNVLHEDLLYRSKLFMKTLLLSDFNSHQGIQISADIPRCCSQPIINLKRPAVLRVYYGLTQFTNSSPYVSRPTYGPTRLCSSVGIDPRQYRTKPFCQELSIIADYLKKLVTTYKVTGFDNSFDHQFNHCTVLIYRSEGDTKSNSSLSYHCDSTYDTNGTFKASGNTQLERSLVFVLTLGDSRELNFKLRAATDNKWTETNIEIPSVHLHHNSLFILHYKDEVPTLREGCPYLSQIMHGGIKLEGKGKLSFAMCFRAVTKIRQYNPITNNLVVENEDLSSVKLHMEAALHKKQFEENEMNIYQKQYHRFVNSKFEEWKWFSEC